MSDGTISQPSASQPSAPQPSKPQPGPIARLRHRLYIILEGGKSADWPSRIFDAAMITLIVLNVASVAAETVPVMDARYDALLQAINAVSVLIFTVEYVARLWVCVEHPPLRGLNPLAARIRFAATPLMVLDLLVILPFYLAFLIPLDLAALRIFRLLRFMKLLRFSPALSSLFAAINAERRALLGALVVMIGTLMIAASLLYDIERHAQPEAFGTIPDAMWWAMATLTTVGYGDVVPVTPLGKLVGTFVMLLGLAMFAIPIGIIATGFSQQIHRRDFVVDWGLIARVPIFSDLDAVSFARIMGLLHARTVDAGSTIIRAGDAADGLYFLALGTAECGDGDAVDAMEEGDWFGEAALSDGAQAHRTVRAVTKCYLLFIAAEDFRDLMDRAPDLWERIRAAVEKQGPDDAGGTPGTLS